MNDSGKMYCTGCLNKVTCTKQDDIEKMTPVRVASGKKYFKCHNLVVERPAYSNKEARRLHGEAAVHY